MRIAGASVDSLVERFGLGGKDCLYRHMHKHVSADVRAMIVADIPVSELAQRAVAESMSLIDYLSLARKVVVEQMLVAKSLNDSSGVAKTVGRLVEVLTALGRLTGELMASPAVMNITNNNYATILASPAFVEIERMLVERLAPYPDALRAVVSGLEALDAAHVHPPQAHTAPLTLEASVAA